MRRALLSLLLAGCDLVYGLEGRLPPEAQPGDEDGDGRLDDVDPCPHIADESAIDRDEDGISADCDPDDNHRGTMFRWFPINAGSVEELRMSSGIGNILGDGYQLGDPDHTEHSSLVFDVDTATALVDVGFEMISNSIEDEMEQPWAELGVMTVHRSFIPMGERRGDVCYYGISHDEDESSTVGYLELNEDEVHMQTVNFPPPLNGTTGRLHMLRDPREVTCGVFRPGKTPVGSSFDVGELADVTGKIAISTERVVAKLTYVWIAWQPIE